MFFSKEVIMFIDMDHCTPTHFYHENTKNGKHEFDSFFLSFYACVLNSIQLVYLFVKDP